MRASEKTSILFRIYGSPDGTDTVLSRSANIPRSLVKTDWETPSPEADPSPDERPLCQDGRPLRPDGKPSPAQPRPLSLDGRPPAKPPAHMRGPQPRRHAPSPRPAGGSSAQTVSPSLDWRPPLQAGSVQPRRPPVQTRGHSAHKGGPSVPTVRPESRREAPSPDGKPSAQTRGPPV